MRIIMLISSISRAAAICALCSDVVDDINWIFGDHRFLICLVGGLKQRYLVWFDGEIWVLTAIIAIRPTAALHQLICLSYCESISWFIYRCEKYAQRCLCNSWRKRFADVLACACWFCARAPSLPIAFFCSIQVFIVVNFWFIVFIIRKLWLREHARMKTARSVLPSLQLWIVPITRYNHLTEKQQRNIQIIITVLFQWTSGRWVADHWSVTLARPWRRLYTGRTKWWLL